MWTPAFLTSWFERTWRVVVAASSEAFIPAHPGAPSHVVTGLVARTEAYVGMLPPTQSLLLKLMFVAVEWLTPFLNPGGGRFSKRSPARRLEIVDGWRASWFLPARLLGDALRATLVMVYFSHPDVQLAMGETLEGGPMAEVG